MSGSYLGLQFKGCAVAQVVAGPLAGGLLSPLAAAWVGTGGVLLNVAYTAVCVRESLPPAARKQVHDTIWCRLIHC